MREGTAPLIRREDYAAPAYWIRKAEFVFDLDPAKTLVASRLEIERHAALADGSLTAERVDSYLKLQAELAENADPVAAAQDARQRGRVGARALRSRLRDKGRR